MLSSSNNPAVLDALLKVETLIAAKQQQLIARALAMVLCKRFRLVADPELFAALAPDLKTRSVEEALTKWISRQSAEPIPAVSEDSIESFATLLRHKLWRIQDDKGEIA